MRDAVNDLQGRVGYMMQKDLIFTWRTVLENVLSMRYLPLYVGINNGAFQKQGLDVPKETAGAPSAALAAVISERAHFSLHGPE